MKRILVALAFGCQAGAFGPVNMFTVQNDVITSASFFCQE
jgi:hypothetical protein